MFKNFRLIALLGLLVFLFSACKKEDATPDKAPPPVFAPGAKLKRVLLFENMSATAPLSIVADYEYNASGNISKITHPFYKDGKVQEIISYDEYEYNTKGTLTTIKNYNANQNVGFLNLRNTSFTYLPDGKKTKELTEFPQINSFEYSTYQYSGTKLIKIENFDHQNQLKNYILNEYDDAGQLTKETLYSADNKPVSYTINLFQHGLNVRSDVYGGTDMQRVREIQRTYDINKNLISLDSKELSWYSSMMSFVFRYEYF